METSDNRANLQRNTGFLIFLISGICAISTGVVVTILQEAYGFAYGMTGTLLSLMSIGNLISGFAAGVFPGKIGMKKTAGILTAGYCVGYLLMGVTGALAVLAAAFFLVGVAKGTTINMCTILVGNHSKNRTRGICRARARNAGSPLRAMVWPTEITAFSPSCRPYRARKASRRAGSGAKKSVSTPLERLYTGRRSP